MIRRLTSRFNRDKKQDGRANGVTPQTNGVNGKQKADVSTDKPQEGEDDSAGRVDVEETFSNFAQVIHASNEPLPTQVGDAAGLEHKEPSSLMQDIKAIGFKDVGTLMQVVKTKATGEYQDDKNMMMEHVMQLVAALPTNSKTRADLTNAFIDELWNSLQHPPMSYLGDTYQYRAGDGSYNNPMFPHLGAANTPYARSVNPVTIPPGALPDPALVFDSIMARNTFTPHPNKVSSVFFYWASLIIHDLFQTNHQDFSISQTSSYLDLSTLYGDTQEDQDQIRTFQDGKLKPDCFSEARLLGFPPGCGVLLIMLNRFHNYVVEQLAVVNERQRFTKPKGDLPSEAADKAWAKYDNDLFQTGRLIVCGFYINITLYDYLRTIVNLNRSNTTWSLDPRAEMAKTGHFHTDYGMGNQVSAEFNLAYRWHSAISEKDEQWTEGLYKQLFGKSAEDVTLPELLRGLGKWEHGLDQDPQKRPFANLKRDANGKFPDQGLVDIITSSIEDTAGAFGANNIPKCLKAITVLGMQQARTWNLASLNEFRKFFLLKPHDTFDAINPDPVVAEQLKHLYEHPDYVEMYPGMVTENAKEPMVPGVGIAPNYTISRAILSDAVTLVRGDRFYTTDYNARNLTNWGYSEVQYDLNINQGCVIYKLFLRAFPDHFKSNSVYAHYPMTIPSENKKIMRNLGREDHYSWDKPGLIPPRVNLTSYIGAKYILEHPKDFKVLWGEATGYPIGKSGWDIMLSGDSQLNTKQRKLIGDTVSPDKWHQQIKDFYEHITLKLLHQHSSHIHFAANVFSLPLKTEEHPHGVYNAQELYMAMAVVFIILFFDLDPAKSFPLRQAGRAVTQQLGKLVEAHVKAVNRPGWISTLVEGMAKHNGPLTDFGTDKVKKLHESGLGVSEITWSYILPSAGAMVANQAQVFTQLLDYYLSDDGKQHLPEINRLAKANTADADNKILHYAMEGIRLNGTFGSYHEGTTSVTIDDGGRPVSVKSGDQVFCSFAGANREAEVFPNPNKVDTNRNLDSYIHYGTWPHACLGKEASRVALTAMLKVVGGLDNLRRAPGAQGQYTHLIPCLVESGRKDI
ncbi:MAG: hypothetical protein Q9195_001052 [Heterodermia aff. obscurata]